MPIYYKTTRIYDLEEKIWSGGAAMMSARCYVSVAQYNNKIYAMVCSQFTVHSSHHSQS